VYVACAGEGRATEIVRHDFGDRGRERVRLESVRSALSLLEGILL
jgi:nicotinamide mononucleotide (NMN) deamidase PncC